MEDTSFLLQSYRLRAGPQTPVPAVEIGAELAADGLAWVHLDGTAAATEPWLRSHVQDLDALAIAALLAEETRPRIMPLGKGALIILRGVNMNADAAVEDMVSIRLWVDPKRVISVERRPLKAAVDIGDRIAAGRGPVTVGGFLTLLVARLNDRIDLVLGQLGDQIDAAEEAVIDAPDGTLRRDVAEMRRKTLALRRYIAPQRDVIAQLVNERPDWLADTDQRALREGLDRLYRTVEELDLIRERAQIIKDELASHLSDAMNRNMYVLTLVGAIFLPLGFLTGLLGINVGGMPMAEWGWGFWVTCGGLLACVALEVWLFRRLKWL